MGLGLGSGRDGTIPSQRVVPFSPRCVLPPPLCMQNGETPLHTAAFQNASASVELLLKAKASMEVKDKVIYGRGVVGCGVGWGMACVKAYLLVIAIRAHVEDNARVIGDRVLGFMIVIRERYTVVVRKFQMQGI